MEIVNFRESSYGQVGARGACPHCGNKSFFQPVTSGHVETLQSGHQRVCNAAQCQACKEYVLVVGRRNVSGAAPLEMENVYPLRKPNDAVDPAVPPAIADDFKEALRSFWVDAHKATVSMCRRAIQASALDKKASPKKKLIEQIDELAANGIITQPLREMAHEVRLTGNVGAHPDEDGLKDVTEKDAQDIIEFTREFFHHVYVMPAKLAARRKPVPAAAANP